MFGPMNVGDPASDFSRLSRIKLYFTGTGTISGGVIIAEEAPTKDFAGTWSPITGVSLTASQVSAGSAVKAFAFPDQAYRWVRIRETTPVSGGGSVQAEAEGFPATW